MLSMLGSMPVEVFLSEYWQKKPCVLRKVIKSDDYWIDPDELAGLACEDQFPSRIVLCEGEPQDWSVKHGPQRVNDFSELPATHWSLLVQHVDRYVDQIGALRDLFSFIPNWRLDDVMISYAAPEGSVGPHLDHYDVFLLQGEGARTWYYNVHPEIEDEWIPDIEIRILPSMKFEKQVQLEQGDVLYIPPGFAHHGVSKNPSMTYSIGFRAPNAYEFTRDYVAAFENFEDERVRYNDPDRQATATPAEIKQNDIEKFRKLIVNELEKPWFINWLGQYLTSAEQECDAGQSDNQMMSKLKPGEIWRRSDDVTFAYTMMDGVTAFFVAGEPIDVHEDCEELMRVVFNSRKFTIPDLGVNAQSVLSSMADRGWIYPNSSDD